MSRRHSGSGMRDLQGCDAVRGAYARSRASSIAVTHPGSRIPHPDSRTNT